MSAARRNLLFVCSKNQLRSPTAQRIFSNLLDWETRSAGTDRGAAREVSAELLAWADMIVVMEVSHQKKLRRSFREEIEGKKLVVLGIPDEYRYMDPALIRLLRGKVSRHIDTTRVAEGPDPALLSQAELADLAESLCKVDDRQLLDYYVAETVSDEVRAVLAGELNRRGILRPHPLAPPAD